MQKEEYRTIFSIKNKISKENLTEMANNLADISSGAVTKTTKAVVKGVTEEKIRDEFQYLSYAPIIFVSAETKQRLHKLPELIKAVSQAQNMRIPSAVLNDVIMDAIAINPTPTDKGRRLKIFYATQVAIKPPTFVVFVNEEELMHFSYGRMLENQIRKAFVFEGTPIHLISRKRK